MSEQDSDDIIIPEGAMYYQCSNCTYINTTYYAVQTHTKNKPECKTIGATVVQKLKAAASTPEIEDHVEAALNPVDYSPPVTAPAQGTVQRPQSMAQLAGTAPSPQWAGALRDQEPEEETDDFADYEQQSGYLPIDPNGRDVRFSQMPVIRVPPEVQVFYAAYCGMGFMRTLEEWAWGLFFDYMTLMEISVTINDIPPQVREEAMARSGLYDE